VTAGALTLGGIALLQRSVAVTERDHATTETVFAETSLANQVRREGDPLRGTLIAIEAFQSSGGTNAPAAKTEAYDTLLGSFLASGPAGRRALQLRSFAAARQYLAFADMVGGGDDAFRFHPFDNPSCAVVADLKVALHKARRSLAFAAHHRDGLRI
jgi:hypothetical protein